MTRTNMRWRPSRFGLILAVVLGGAYFLYIALCMFAAAFMNQKVGSLSIAVITAIALLLLSVVTSIAYLIVSSRRDENADGAASQ